MSNKVFLSLGSNMGNRENNLMDAIKLFPLSHRMVVVKTSNIYETEPVGFTEQDKFLNMAVKVETVLEPLSLLEELQKIETLLKRTRELQWGPRTIDIDILLYDNLSLELPSIKIPHPRMFERAFVLIPFRDIYTDNAINGMHITDLIERCSDKSGVKLFRELVIDNFNIF